MVICFSHTVRGLVYRAQVKLRGVPFTAPTCLAVRAHCGTNVGPADIVPVPGSQLIRERKFMLSVALFRIQNQPSASCASVSHSTPVHLKKPHASALCYQTAPRVDRLGLRDRACCWIVYPGFLPSFFTTVRGRVHSALK